MVSDASLCNNILKDLFSSNVSECIIEYLSAILTNPHNNIGSSDDVYKSIKPFILALMKIEKDDEVRRISDSIFNKLTSVCRIDNCVDTDTMNTQEKCVEKVNLTIDSFSSNDISGYEDPFLCIKRRNRLLENDYLNLDESDKVKREESHMKKEKRNRLVQEWEKNKANLPTPIRIVEKHDTPKANSINIDNFSVSVTGRELLKNASLKIVIGRKYGLIGRNGIGKSTFLACLARHEIPGVHKGYNIAYAEQELNDSLLDVKVIDSVLNIHLERTQLLNQEKQIAALPANEENGEKLLKIYERLQEIESDEAESEACNILAGLGFSEAMMGKKIKNLSGGWRMRIALARALFASPDILCLDEPTNHLDLHAVAWLTNFLIKCPITCIIVSHARHFLNEVCTDIIDFRDKNLKYYRGNYDAYEKNKEAQDLALQREIIDQEKKIAHIQKFINKFRYNAATASMAQSRIKALERLPNLEKISNDPSLRFEFVSCNSSQQGLIQITNIWFSYDSPNNPNDDHWILKDITLSISSTSRIAICGVNGCGKSTLLKLIAGIETPTKGSIMSPNKVSIGYFTQHHVDQLDLTLNAVQQLQKNFSDENINDENARKYLGRFGITGLLALEPLYILSGGEKNRVAISLMAYKNPQLLILDEPTNHLDLDAIQALIVALNEFNGGVIIVSHDIHLLSCVIDEIYHFDTQKKSIIRYSKDIESYKKDYLRGELF